MSRNLRTILMIAVCALAGALAFLVPVPPVSHPAMAGVTAPPTVLYYPDTSHPIKQLGKLLLTGSGVACDNTSNASFGTCTISGSGSALTDTLAFSIADAAAKAGGSNVASGGGTTGQAFNVTQVCSITGGKFFWSGSNKTIRVALWGASSSALATKDVTTSGTNTYTATFASPVSVTGTDVYTQRYYITMSEQTNSAYEKLNVGDICLPGASASGLSVCGNNTNNPTMNGRAIQTRGYNFFNLSINTKPNSGGTGTNNEYYPIDPVYTCP